MSERLDNTGRVVGAYDIDLDSGDMEAVSIMDGWKRFRIRDVSTAAYFAMKKGNASSDERWRIFLDRLEERTLIQEPEPEYLTGSRRLCAEDISFAEDIIQNDNLLEFYMEVSFNADEVFGTDVCTSENDDWLNIYANYDLEARRVCDTLEVYLQRGNGDEEAFKYRLSAEEQALLLPKMNAYCQEHWSQTLEECSADYLAEQNQDSRRCRCSAVLPPVSRCVRLSAASRPCTPPEGNGRNLGRFPREREADESEAGERAGDNAAPGSPTSARSAGSFRLFAAGTIRRVERAVGPYDAEKLRCGKGSQRGLDEKRSGFTEVRKQKNEEGVLDL